MLLSFVVVKLTVENNWKIVKTRRRYNDGRSKTKKHKKLQQDFTSVPGWQRISRFRFTLQNFGDRFERRDTTRRSATQEILYWMKFKKRVSMSDVCKFVLSWNAKMKWSTGYWEIGFTITFASLSYTALFCVSYAYFPVVDRHKNWYFFVMRLFNSIPLFKL